MNKNKGLVLLIGSVALIVVFFVSLLNFNRSNYLRMIKEYNENTEIFNYYTMIFDDYFAYYFTFPANEAELDKFEMKINDPLYKRIDPFSRTQERFLYIPLYNKKNKLREGYILLSSGIDGKINNIIYDTVFLNDINRFQLYNAFSIISNNQYKKPDNDFNMFDYYFGGKDLLVEYVNGINRFTNNAISMGDYSPTGFAKKYSQILRSEKTTISVAITGEVIEINDSLFVVADNMFQVYCKPYIGQSIIDLNIGDIIRVIGRCRNSIDENNKIIYLENCLVNR